MTSILSYFSSIEPLLMIILVGIALGAFWGNSSSKAKDHCKETDSFLLGYLFPMMFVIAGTGFRIDSGYDNLVVIGILFFMAIIGTVLTWFIARKILGLKAGLMTMGFMVLTVCANTGHGLMLLLSSTTDREIEGLGLAGFYVGFIVVVFFPQIYMASESGKSYPEIARQTLVAMAFHPVSIGCILGFGYAIYPIAGFAYAGLMIARIAIDRKWEKQWQMTAISPVINLTITLGVVAVLRHFELSKFIGYFPLIITGITAWTIGIKMTTQKMEWEHWKIVAAIVVYGLFIAPAIALGVAKAMGCSFAVAYVVSYMSSQPPAYLGMKLLSEGKFGDLAVSEWAFALQACGAYSLAILIPDLIKAVY